MTDDKVEPSAKGNGQKMGNEMRFSIYDGISWKEKPYSSRAYWIAEVHKHPDWEYREDGA